MGRRDVGRLSEACPIDDDTLLPVHAISSVDVFLAWSG